MGPRELRLHPSTDDLAALHTLRSTSELCMGLPLGSAALCDPKSLSFSSFLWPRRSELFRLRVIMYAILDRHLCEVSIPHDKSVRYSPSKYYGPY